MSIISTNNRVPYSNKRHKMEHNKIKAQIYSVIILRVQVQLAYKIMCGNRIRFGDMLEVNKSEYKSKHGEDYTKSIARILKTDTDCVNGWNKVKVSSF